LKLNTSSGVAPLRAAHVATVSAVLQSLLLGQMRSIQDSGYDVTGIATPDDWTDQFAASGLRYIPVRIEREIALFRDLISLWQLYRLFRREKFMIVHTHNPKAGLLGQLAARLAGVPIVLNTVHGFYFHDHMSPVKRRLFVTLEKIAALCSDSILSQNQEDMRVALEEKICSPNKISHLGNGIDLSKFDPELITPEVILQKRTEIGLQDGTPVVGFVGRLAAKRKGFEDFLVAARQVADRLPSVRFLIVGRSDRQKSDAARPSIAQEHGVAEHCIFLGFQPNSQMPVFYRLMNVLVLPSLFEGIPRAVMEASAMKVPIVATNVKGNREAVDHDRNGLLVPLGDTTALADAILHILTDHDCAYRMGEAGRQIALERFDERLVFEKVKAEYARLLSKKGIALPVLPTPAET
jgi:glycosyltransferase involved in cell wall biosynthesis